MTELSSRMKRRIKRKLRLDKPSILIGKNGVSQELVEEIGKQLKKKEMVKFKILKSALRRSAAKQIASGIAEQTGGLLVEVRGHTFMLYKCRKSESLYIRPHDFTEGKTRG